MWKWNSQGSIQKNNLHLRLTVLIYHQYSENDQVLWRKSWNLGFQGIIKLDEILKRLVFSHQIILTVTLQNIKTEWDGKTRDELGYHKIDEEDKRTFSQLTNVMSGEIPVSQFNSGKHLTSFHLQLHCNSQVSINDKLDTKKK